METLTEQQIYEIIKALNEAKIVAVPTETVYGLAVKLDSERAVLKLMGWKDRGIESGKVFTLMVADKKEIENYAQVSNVAGRIIEKYFPGELTLVLPKNEQFKHFYFDNFETIGMRVPDHKFMLELLRQTGPLLVTSANLRGGEPAKSFEEVEKLGIDVVVRGETGGSLPSTIVKIENEEIKILRQGELRVV